MYKIIFFPEKNNLKKCMCLPYLKFSDLLPEKHLFFFIWPNQSSEKGIQLYRLKTITCNPLIYHMTLCLRVKECHAIKSINH